MKVFKKQGRNNIGQYRKKESNVFVLWGEKPKTWGIVKDFMLCLFLLNMLVNQLQGVKIVEIVMTDAKEAAKNSIAEEAKAAVVQEDEKENKEARRVENESVGEFSAYNSDEAQTDSDPFTMANGKRVHAGAIANNCLAFGTKVEVDGMGTFTVEDRMNKRYGCDHFDIWMEKYSDAIEFGRKSIAYEVGR